MKDKIKMVIKESMEELIGISRFIHDNPEMGYEEYKSSQRIEKSLIEHNFAVEKGIYGIDTAFRATYESNKEGPKVAFMCEYDALPEIGHGCGHNLISAMGLGASIGLQSVIDKIGGTIVVFGTPAEETSGAKVEFVRRGAFDDIMLAMMVHPGPITEESGTSLALIAIQLEFTGKAAHAAKSPEQGINALDAAILFFNGVNALRQHVTSDVKIHGIIAEGGQAPNIVPDKSVVRVYVRAAKKERRDEVAKKVINCAHGAEMMTGATLKISYFEEPYDDLKTNKVLSSLFNENLLSLGEKEIKKNESSMGSLDMGNVSYAVPAIHPWIGLGDSSLSLHSKEFAVCTLTQRGEEAIYKGACAMAMTAFDVITSEELQKKIKEEFLKENC